MANRLGLPDVTAPIGIYNLPGATTSPIASADEIKRAQDLDVANAAARAKSAEDAKIAEEARQRQVEEQKTKDTQQAAMKLREAEELRAQQESEALGKAMEGTPEEQKARADAIEQQRKMATGELSYAEIMGQRLAEKAAKQQMALAYARGYDPTAVRGAQKAAVETVGEIAAQTQEAKIKEQQLSQQGYLQALQYQQQIRANIEQAKKNYLLGNRELAQQNMIESQKLSQNLQIAMIDNQTKLESIRAQIATNEAQNRTTLAAANIQAETARTTAATAAEAQRYAANQEGEGRQTGALLGAGSTILASILGGS